MRLSSHHQRLGGARCLLVFDRMRMAIALLVVGACGGGGTTEGPDAGVTCALPASEADAGSVTALEAQRCNVSGSHGATHWYRMLAALPSGAMDIVQLELWPNHGAFAGGDVHTGTFTITGDDADPVKCGVCVRAVGHHGDAASQMLYFATAGTVQVDSFGDAPIAFTASITSATFDQVTATGAPASPSCPVALAHVAVSGPTVNAGGTGGGGGGGGGSGTGGCVSTVGDL